MAPPIPMVEWDEPVEVAFDELERHPPCSSPRPGRRSACSRGATCSSSWRTVAASYEQPCERSGSTSASARASTSSCWTTTGRSSTSLRAGPRGGGRRHDRRARPDVVAIDSPPAWALAGRSRLTERELAVVRHPVLQHAVGSPDGRAPVLRVDDGRASRVFAGDRRLVPADTAAARVQGHGARGLPARERGRARGRAAAAGMAPARVARARSCGARGRDRRPAHRSTRSTQRSPR